MRGLRKTAILLVAVISFAGIYWLQLRDWLAGRRRP
jgi:hypothetical protein